MTGVRATRLLPLAVLLGIGCAEPLVEHTLDDDIDAFVDEGPYEVGYTTFDTTYDDPVYGGPRNLPLMAWYPASAPSDTPAIYSLGGVIVFESLRATYDADPADGAPFPVIVYSHGNGSEAVLGHPYGEHLASHGYIVVAVSHTYNTGTDGTFRRFAPLMVSLVRRPQDITAAIDHLEDGDAPDGLAAIADTGRVMVFGHSYGGFTTVASAAGPLDIDGLRARFCAGDADCSVFDDEGVQAQLAAGFRDPRVVAIAPQAPGFVSAFAPPVLGDIDVPTLLMTGRRDKTLPDEEQAQVFWAGLSHPEDVWFEIPDGAHQTFIPTCRDFNEWQKDQFVGDAEEDGCGPDFAPSEQLIPLMAGYLRRWADTYVKLAPPGGDWRTVAPSDLVVLSRH